MKSPHDWKRKNEHCHVRYNVRQARELDKGSGIPTSTAWNGLVPRICQWTTNRECGNEVGDPGQDDNCSDRIGDVSIGPGRENLEIHSQDAELGESCGQRISDEHHELHLEPNQELIGRHGHGMSSTSAVLDQNFGCISLAHTSATSCSTYR